MIRFSIRYEKDTHYLIRASHLVIGIVCHCYFVRTLVGKVVMHRKIPPELYNYFRNSSPKFAVNIILRKKYDVGVLERWRQNTSGVLAAEISTI